MSCDLCPAQVVSGVAVTNAPLCVDKFNDMVKSQIC